MSDRMTPIPFAELMNWIITEREKYGTVFALNHAYQASIDAPLTIFGEYLETPFGPAAGPNTQLAQNIIASYYAGARFFELKTVQTLDGEDLPVAKPCILAEDECYNVEWSTELRVGDAFNEYVKAWYALKLISQGWGLGEPDGFIFNMSVGYDFKGIASEKIDNFIEGLKDARNTPIWKECEAWARENWKRINPFMIHNWHPDHDECDDECCSCCDCDDDCDECEDYDDCEQAPEATPEEVDAFFNAIPSKICRSITLSTLHGCPPQEIEKIASYLIDTKHLHTFVKCNPTLLGYEFARRTLDEMGYDYIVFDDNHFLTDLQYKDAVPMFRRLLKLAAENNVTFGVKLTNTFPVDITRNELPGNEMYMSGRSLYPLTTELARRLTTEFDGQLRISYSGGADHFNIKNLFDAGIWPITMATTLLKPGGYQRFTQMAEDIIDPSSICFEFAPWKGVSVSKITRIAHDARTHMGHVKAIKPAPKRKIEGVSPRFDCFIAPCSHGCPINQDIPEYISLVGQEKYAEALSLIMRKNPLPFITGTICSHRCQEKCTRNFYEEAVRIRNAKLLAAREGFGEVLEELKPKAEVKDKKAAVIGGGPGGMAAAFFLARRGVKTVLFEKRKELGGIVRWVIPEFRIENDAIENDVAFLDKLGCDIRAGVAAPSLKELKEQGFTHVIYAIGAWSPGSVELEEGKAMNVIEFLEKRKAGTLEELGENVAVIGGGNTAMDAARAAKRSKGVKHAYLVYRRDRRNMPADEEELELALNDGVEFKELLAPVSLKNGELICKVMKLGEPDASGRRKPVETGETASVPCNTLIAAVGEKVEKDIFTANGIELNERGRAAVNENMETNIPGVFVVGDARRGPATVVEAIADARKAADTITGPCQCAKPDDILSAECIQTSFDEVEDVRTCNLTGLFCDPDRDEKCSACTVNKQGKLALYSSAKHEAERCLACSAICECCVQVCPNRAYVPVKVEGKKNPAILHIDRMCNYCGNCAVFCPYDSSPYREKFSLFSTVKEFDESDLPGFVRLSEKEFKVRNGEVKTITLGKGETCADLEKLIQAVVDHYSYLL